MPTLPPPPFPSSGLAGGAGSGPQTLWNRQGLSSGPGPLPRLTAGEGGCYLSAQGAGEKPSKGPGVRVDRGWGRILSFLKAGEELGLLTGLKGEAVGPRSEPYCENMPGSPRIQCLTQRT